MYKPLLLMKYWVISILFDSGICGNYTTTYFVIGLICISNIRCYNFNNFKDCFGFYFQKEKYMNIRRMNIVI